MTALTVNRAADQAALQLLDLAVGQPDAVALLLPVAPVAGDLAQLLLDIYVVAARLLARRADDLLRQADLAGDFDSERTSGFARLQTEKGLYLLHVEEHCPVGDSLRPGCEVFDVGDSAS